MNRRMLYFNSKTHSANTRGQSRSVLPHSRAGRRGLVLVAVLFCLAAAALTIMAILRTTTIELSQLRSQQQQLQLDRLAEAGVERARAQLAASPTYQGETWSLTADELGGASAAAVVIAVAEVKDQANQRQIRVQADYPIDTERRSCKSREILFHLP
jgi:hypothetical protein